MAKVTALEQNRRAYSFSRLPAVKMPRSVFDLTHTHKTAIDSSYLYPICVNEALPGDTHTVRTAAFARLATLLYPIIDNLYLDIFWFSVPIRILWDNFKKFCGEQVDPGDSTDYSVPQFSGVTVAEESLSDYMGLPLGSNLDFNSLWHRAYNMIWRDWFRSEDLQDSPVVDTGDGPDTLSNYVLLKRGKRHDYFTSCLPFTQKGDPVELPLGTSAPIVGTGDLEPEFLTGATHSTTTKIEERAAASTIGVVTDGGASSYTLQWDDPKLEANLTAATAATINDIREAFQVQRMLERDARGGTRYSEIVRSHFGVINPDTQWRPEYLGGGTVRININPVENTALLGGGYPQLGELGAYGLGMSYGIGFTKSFTEHSVILCLANIRAPLTYQQGIPRMFSRQDRYDYFWPSLAHLGEQAVLNKEIYAQGTSADDDPFGYQERYAEYRYMPSRVSGVFRSDHSASLDPWHLALDFSSLPLLNDTFIEDAPPMARILATPAEPDFLCDFGFDYQCVRPMPTRSTPGLIDHF